MNLKKKKEKNTKLKTLSIIQIAILVLGTIAISYAIGSSIGVVSATALSNLDPEMFKPPNVEEMIDPLSDYNKNIDVAARAAVDNAKKTPPTTSVPTDKATVSAAKKTTETITHTLSGKDYENFIFRKKDGVWEASSDGGESWFSGLNDNTINKLESDTVTGIKGFFNARKAFLGEIIKNAGVASMIYMGIGLIGPIITSDAQAISAAQKAISIGYMTATSLDDVFGLISPKWGTSIKDFLIKDNFIGVGSNAFLIGTVVTVAIFLYSYKKTEELKVTYTCDVWDAPTGGKNCEKCNEGILPCTEYQCKSLGQACELLNPGTTEETCAWVNPNDVNPPIIKPWNDALLNSDYSYSPDNRISPPDSGVYILYNKDCIPAFTPFQFGIVLNEPAKCKIDPQNKESFDEMNMYFGGSSTLKYNHTQTITLPSAESLAAENITLKNGGNFDLYVRCQDANGNYNIGSFVFKYCVDEGPDATPPLIVSTSILSGKPVAFNQSELALEVYLNEPAECRWNHDVDTSFDNMENKFKCSTSVFEMNAQMLYKCTGTLSGIRDRVENKFYFRCKDKPTATKDRNENIQGYEFIVYGTQPLIIDYASPNNTLVKDSTSTVKVTLETRTLAGYKEGEAVCWYAESCIEESGSKDYFVDVIGEDETTYSHEHLEDVWLVPGDYECRIKCVDLGGNTDEVDINYEVETDETSPVVVRIFHEESYLKLITDEYSECVYGISDCNYLFEDGVKINTIDSLEHFTKWEPDKTYYIKCKDKFENQPFPSECNIIVRPSQDYSV